MSSLDTDEGEVLVLVASDGAGSAEHSEVGSRLACETVIGVSNAWFLQGRLCEEIDRAVIEDWLLDALKAISEEAERREVRPRALACTMLLAVVAPEMSWFAQLGDGGIVVRRHDAYEVVFWPQSGEYANMTYFLTDAEALTRVQYTSVIGDVPEIAVFTDGIQPLALHYATKTAHEPFFRPMFTALSQQPAGEAHALRSALIAFLGSPRINERTDDDKTLVIATRVAPMPRLDQSAPAPPVQAQLNEPPGGQA